MTIPERIRMVEKFKIKKVNIGNITADMKNEVVKIIATVQSTNKRTFSSGNSLYQIDLKDATGSVTLTLFSKSYEALDSKIQKILFKSGNKLELIVSVDEYKGSVQLNLLRDFMLKSYNLKVEDTIKLVGKGKVSSSTRRTGSSTQTSPRHSTKTIPIRKITGSMKNKTVKVKGKVKNIRWLSGHKHMKLTIDDGTDKIQLMMWESKLKYLKGKEKYIKVGKTVTAVCKVAEYRGTVELNLLTSSGFKVE